MDQESSIQDLRRIALEVGEVHAQQLEAWEATKTVAIGLARLIYEMAGVRAPLPPEHWAWGASSIPKRIIEATVDARSRMLQPQQGGHEGAGEALNAVAAILAATTRFKPGMSQLGRLTEVVKEWGSKGGGKGGDSNPLSLSIKTIGPDDPIVIDASFMCESHEQFEAIRERFPSGKNVALSECDDKAEFQPHEMSPADIEKRLVAMREHYELSDEEVVAKALDGTLPPDPNYCEWLVLLGRSDLIGG